MLFQKHVLFCDLGGGGLDTPQTTGVFGEKPTALECIGIWQSGTQQTKILLPNYSKSYIVLHW